ncbi:MAG: hypothetical protein WA373_06310 [Burkholderiales bacterium]
MADAREARKILDEIPAGEPFKAIEELSHWIESVCAAEGFKPEHRAQLVQAIDDAAQMQLRKLQRDYLSMPRLSRFQENRLWTSMHGYWRQSALAFATCIDLYATGQKGADRLKNNLPLLTVRALRALAAQIKWQYVRYGPCENFIWGVVARIYALAENRKFARTRATVYPGVPGESSPEQEFLKAVMLSASSPDSLLPVEIELAERLIAHFSASFTLRLDQQPDIAYWIDLATSRPPLRLARPPQHAPTLRFFAAGKAAQELTQLIQTVASTNAVPSGVALGGSYEPEVVLDVLNHLALYWSPKPPERKAPRHRVKSRLSATHGYDGVLAALDRSTSLDFDESSTESWIVENVSAGGFGASIPQIKGEWVKIGCLLGLQPEGGSNWVIGVIRRFTRESPQQGTVGIQTLARTALLTQLKLQSGTGSDPGTGILLNPSDDGAEAHLLLRPGVLATGQNLEIERNGKRFLLMPAGVTDRGDDYEIIRCRQMIRETGE